MLYENWIDALKLNKTLQTQILQLGKDKGALEKEVVVLKREISKNSTTHSELEQLKKRVRMAKTPNGHEDLGYKKGSSETKAAIRIDAQAKLSCSKNVVQTNPILTNPRTGPSSSNKRRPRGIRCYYYRMMGHIRPQCRHYKADQKKKLKENQPAVKQKWAEKERQKSLWGFTSLNAKAEQR